jgi:hypothetical protein
MAKDGNTYAKRQRETQKKRKAQEKRERRQKRKDDPVRTVFSASDEPSDELSDVPPLEPPADLP